LSRAVADISIFVTAAAADELGELPERIAVAAITAAELELGVLRATSPEARAIRLATLSRVQATYPLLPIDPETASCFARLAAAELARGHRPRRHDTWVAATAMRHGVSVVTRDAGFSSFEEVAVHRV
jgi:toxin FitB